MAGIRTFHTDDTLPTLRADWLYTLARIQKNAHTTALIPGFAAVGPLIEAALKTQSDLDDASVIANAGRDGADQDLDPLMLQVVHALLVVTKGKRDDPLFLSYLGTQTPSEVVRPVLGTELSLAAEWATSLKEETDPGLLALATPMASAVEAGQKAETELTAADKALSTFRLVGDRKKTTDALNAARGELYGALVKFQHEHAELRLPSDWAATFFRHTVKQARFGATIAQVQAHLAKLAEETTAAQAYLAELQQKATEQEEAKARRAEARRELSEARKSARAQQQREKTLKAEAGKKLKKR